MKTQNINHAFLDGVLEGKYPDVYYHFGVSSDDPILKNFKDVKAVIMCGSGGRIIEFADKWSKMNKNKKIYALPKEERFVTRYCAGVLFASHGMGMPSASICLQELMRMIFFLKDGNLDEMDKVFWARVGTSGGVGLEGGTVVVTTDGLMADLKPYRALNGGLGEYWFDGRFPVKIAQDIIDANCDSGIPIAMGKTVAGNEFFLEQFRLDGAVCMENLQSKMNWLNWIHKNGVRNIEMEGAMMAGYLNHWGFSKFAMICCTLLNRLNGDQVTATKEKLHTYSENSGVVLFNYLKKTVK
ncbi:MAG TPA: uridine phosphorylase [Lentisphaeria bacterium]|nr:MAG: uridine phosphorylase [Lentisphaerae bacterium GWF2_38_69]HBM16449.1 uridine phosphorylase [Lentisphaeria bacterium]